MSTESSASDDWLTLAALGVLAFAFADVSHEALGHGLETLAVGDRAVALTTCYFTSEGHASRWIPAAGGLMNLAVGLGSLALLRWVGGLTAHLRYFLVLAAAFNLFFAFGYPAYSGIAQFGDWTAVTAGLMPQWLVRVLLVAVAVAGYYASMLLLAQPLAPFAADAGALQRARLRRVTWAPYLAAIVLACAAGALNPHGWRTMLTAGFPAAAASFGLTQMDPLVPPMQDGHAGRGALLRSRAWIAAAVVVVALFVGVLGPGIRFR